MRFALVGLVVSSWACSFSTHAGDVGDAPPPPMIDAAVDAPPDSPAATVRRKAITIHQDQVPANQTDFPVWIALSDNDIAGRARSDGTDIFFTDGNGAPLDHEIQHWTPPLLQAWVRIPTLRHDADTTIYVEYGDLAKATPPNPAGVFKADFAAVWHLDDTLATAAVADATGTHAGTAAGLAPTAQVAGQLGGGITFNGSGNGSIAFQNMLAGNMPHTISAWVNQNNTNHTSAIVTVGMPMTDKSRFLYGRYGNGATIGCGNFNDDLIPNHDIEGANWKLVHWTLEGANRKNHIYVDGVELANSPMTTTSQAATAGTGGAIGFAPEPDYGGMNGMDGILDEVRIATVARDQDWIATEFANQSSPATFYTPGAEEMVP